MTHKKPPGRCRRPIPNIFSGGPTRDSACSSTGDRSASRRPKSVGRGRIRIRNARTRARSPSRSTTTSTRNSIPTEFDAKEWVAIAKAAGMKYMVLTAKHCDGFLLWDSKVSDYNIMHTPFKRDVCAELAKAAHEAGMKIGWYYSPMDWRDPDCRSENNDRFIKTHPRGAARAADQLRQDRSALVRHRRLRRPRGIRKQTYAMIKKLQPRDRHQQPARPGQDPGKPHGPSARKASARTPITTRRSNSSAASTSSIPGNRA